ncbi:hypothetical protein ACFFN5_01145, partial [Streptomonospora salina]
MTVDPALRTALADAATVNAFFAVDTASGPGAGYPVSDLRRADLLDAEVAAVRSGLAAAAGIPAGAVELRAAASAAYQGLAARLMAPQTAAALCHGIAAPPETLRWRMARGRLYPALGGGAGAAAAAGRPR